MQRKGRATKLELKNHATNSAGSSNGRRMILKVARLLPPLKGLDLRRACIVLISKIRNIFQITILNVLDIKEKFEI